MANKFLDKYEQKSEFHPPQQEVDEEEILYLDEISEEGMKSSAKGRRSAARSSGARSSASRKSTTRSGAGGALPGFMNKKVMTGLGIGLAIILLAVILFFVFNRKVELDDMAGWKAEDVNLWATENKVMLRYTESYNDDVAKGLVISHNPGVGEIVEKGKFLEVSISLGPDPGVLVKVPDFMNMSQTEIQTWETENHMTKVRITASNSKTVEQGKVISFTVNDSSVVGKEVRRDSPVYIIISSGTGATGNVTLPDFTAMTVEMAQKFADDNEIVLEVKEVFDAESVKDQIISQDIDMEEVIKVGDTVVIEVSKGPEIRVPNFYSYDQDMAMTIASQNNIMVTLKEKYSSAAEGKLISQSIAADTLYEEGSILTLTYSLGNKIIIPSYIGGGIDTLTSWVAEQNALGTSMTVKITYTTSNEFPGTIMTQDKANSLSAINSTINVIVSEGKVVYVPDLVADQGAGYDKAITREQALSICEEAGLIAIFVEEDAKDRLEGEVWSQSVAAGKEVQQGSKITLKYKPVKSTVKVPNLVGMTEEEVRAAGYHKSFALTFELMDLEDGSIPVVSSQSVTAGTTVAPGQAIMLQ